jgi:glycosyltransferase involved in cell wall biosynthesis
MPPRLTACVLTYNEEDHIGDCLASLAWADELLVVDSLSTDETVARARSAGARVVAHLFANYAAQRNVALAAVDEGWIFFVDADERATPALGAEVRRVMTSQPEVGWFVPRHNYIFGRLTRGAGWYPDYQARLFQVGRVRYDRPVHEIAVVDGPQGYLTEPLIHYNYRTPAQFHAKQRRYTATEAQILHEQGVRARSHTPFTQGARHFWWRFVTHAGYRDGLHGARLSLYMAYYEWRKYRLLLTNF